MPIVLQIHTSLIHQNVCIKPTCNFSIEKRHRPLRLLRGERHAVHPPGAGILPPTGLRGDLHDHAGPGTRFNALEKLSGGGKPSINDVRA